MNIYYLIFGTLVLIVILYKIYFENRYRWVRYEDVYLDPKGKPCSMLIFRDKLKSDLQVEYFYEYQLKTHLVEAHIKSKNTYERNTKLIRWFRLHREL